MATAGSNTFPASISEHHDPVKEWLRTNVPLFGRELMAGGAAGAIAKTFVAPVERTKILLMTGKAKAGAYHTIKLLFQTEGVAGLFKGNGASCLRIVPYAAIHFSSYEFYKRLLAEGATGSAAAAGSSGVATAARKGTSGSSTDSNNTRDEWADDALVTAEAVAVGSKPVVAVEAEIEGVRTDAVEQPQPGGKGGKQQAGGKEGGGGRRRLGSLEELVAGSMAGATAVLITYPLDVVRTRLAWVTEAGPAALCASSSGTAAAAAAATKAAPAASSAAASAAAAATASSRSAQLYHPDHGICRTVSLIARKEGMAGLYRGLAPTLYGIMPYAGLKFYMYGLLKQWYRESRAAQQLPTSERLPVPVMLMFGGVAGLVAQTATYPLDVVRRRMQVYGLQDATTAVAASSTAASEAAVASAASSAPARGPTTWGTAVAILRNEGARGLVRGLSLNFLKVVPSTAVGFTMYDSFKSYLDIKGTL